MILNAIGKYSNAGISANIVLKLFQWLTHDTEDVEVAIYGVIFPIKLICP
jgi:hypothetical protein